ncbi:hypothetical protein L916_09972, partial [Phytophthora nicotianae]
MVGDACDCQARLYELEVAHPPCDANAITKLPGLSWNHFLRDLKHGEVDQVCMLVVKDAASIAAINVGPADSAPVPRHRPKGAEPKSACE